MRIAFCLALACLGGTEILEGQQLSQLSGFLWDSSGALVPGAGLTVVSEDTGFRRVTTSGTTGGYQLAYLQPGHYKVTVRREGFRTLVRFGLNLDAGQGLRADFHLELGSANDVVTVRDEPPFLSTDDASVGTLVGRNWIENLPLEGRGIQTLLELAPGMIATPASGGEAGQFSINGQRPNTNLFTVDGISANTGVSSGLPAQMPGGSLPNMTAFGSLHSLAPVEGLDEIRLQTSARGQLELSSRSGTNEFHGSILTAIRNQIFDANDWFANSLNLPRQTLRFDDVGVTLGGPIRRNRTFFFLSYEDLRLSQPFTWLTTVPSLSARQNAPLYLQPWLNAFPVPNRADFGGGIAGWTGSSSHPSQFDGGAARIDHALSGKVVLFGRYARTPSSNEFGTAQIQTVQINSQSLTGGLNAELTQSVIHELRVNQTITQGDSAWQSQGTTPQCDAASCNSFYRFSIDGVGDFIAGGAAHNRQQQVSVIDSTQFRWSRHELRFGMDYRRLTLDRSGPSAGTNINAPDMQALLSGNFSISVWQAAQQTAALSQLSAFAEDTWRVSPRLTLTGGLRWSFDPAPHVPPPLIASGAPGFGLQTDVPIWNTRYTNFAPHVGAAFRLTRDGRTVLRSAWGLSYNPDFGAATDGINGAPYNAWQFNAGGAGAGFTPVLVTYDFARDLRVPSTQQWNVSLERSITTNDVLMASYAGAFSGDLLRREVGTGSSALAEIVVATNHGRSDYNAVEVQYKRRLSKAWQALASYTWGHSLDNGSADSAVYWVPSPGKAPSDWASSDFDVRHTFTAALSFFPTGHLRHWSISAMLRARTGFPINVIDSETALGLNFANVFRPDLIPGVPLWLNDSNAAAGRRLNPAAFLPVASVQGTLGRNAVGGFGMSQLDLSLHRTFGLGDKSSLEAGAEAFNVLNQPSFADPERFLSSPLFGQTSSMLNRMLGNGTPSTGLTPAFQAGGPRALQIVLRLRF